MAPATHWLAGQMNERTAVTTPPAISPAATPISPNITIAGNLVSLES